MSNDLLSPDLLRSLELDVDSIGDLIERISDYAPTTADQMRAMVEMTSTYDQATADAVWHETSDMRRTHVAAIVALVDLVHQHMASLVAAAALEGWLPDDVLNAPAQAAEVMHEALHVVVDELATRGKR